jgi:hypothetical protein
MKHLLIILALITAFAAPATAQTALQHARHWNDSLIKPKQPITALQQHALDSVMLDAADMAAFLRAQPGYGEGKVLTVQSGAFVWTAGGSPGGSYTTLTTDNDLAILTDNDLIIIQAP